jgi:hypothetical protein
MQSTVLTLWCHDQRPQGLAGLALHSTVFRVEQLDEIVIRVSLAYRVFVITSSDIPAMDY